jgi:hypothetical protein
MSSSISYLPALSTHYVDPTLSKEKRVVLTQERQRKIDEAITFLANFDISKRNITQKASCISPPCDNSVCNLVTYLVTRPLDIIYRAFCCCIPSNNSKYPRAIPKDAADTLAGTTEQFERNVCGVCCIAPAVIISTPFIPASTLITQILSIISGLVITTTAGTNTYVFSGDIEVMPDGRGNLIVQGGIRVDAISVIQVAYAEISKRLKEKWRSASKEEREMIAAECNKIREKWHFIFDNVMACGIQNQKVETILGPFSIVLSEILDEYEECTAHNSFETSALRPRNSKGKEVDRSEESTEADSE